MYFMHPIQRVLCPKRTGLVFRTILGLFRHHFGKDYIVFITITPALDDVEGWSGDHPASTATAAGFNSGPFACFMIINII